MESVLTSSGAKTDENQDVELSPLEQLALAYAPAATKNVLNALLSLDRRLAGVVLTAREPMLAQIRLAWWRDTLALPVADRPRGEPLIAQLAPLGESAGLARLVNGWEALVRERPWSDVMMAEHVTGRGALFGAAAGAFGGDPELAGREGAIWAAWDLARVAPPDADIAAAWTVARDKARGSAAPRWPRTLRPLAVLANFARGELGRSPTPREPAGALALLRLVGHGLTGR